MNKNIKKLLAVVLVLVMALGSVAAATGTEGGNAPEPAPSGPLPSEPLPSEPLPSEPVPSEPVPSEPVPSEPVPSEPVPSEPVPSEPVPSEPAALPVWQVLFGLRSSEAFEAKLKLLLPGEEIPAEDIEALKAVEDVNEFYTAFRALLIRLSGGSEAALDAVLLLSADAEFSAAYGNIAPAVPGDAISPETAAGIVERLLAAESMAAFDEIEAGLSEAELEAVAAYLAGQSEKAAALEEKIDSFSRNEDRIPFVPVTVPYLAAGPFMGAVKVESKPAPVRVKSYGLKNAAPATFGNTEEDDGIELSKTVKDNKNGTYTVRLESYTTGKVTTETKSIPMDVVLVIDQSGSMSDEFGAITRQAAMKTAVNGFIDAVAEKYDAGNNADHRMAIVTFGSNLMIPGKWTNVDSSGEKTLHKAINDLTDEPYNEATNIGAGMERAQALMGEEYSYAGTNTNRQKVVIVFTDGVPTTSNEFSISVANTAIAAAKTMKDNKVTVYSVGIFNGADPGQLYGTKGTVAGGTTAQKWAEDNGVWKEYETFWNGPFPGLEGELKKAEGDNFTFVYYDGGLFGDTKLSKDFIRKDGVWYVAIKSGFEVGGKVGEKGYWWRGSNEDIPAANRFMNYMSSNYPGAENIGLKYDKVQSGRRAKGYIITANYGGSNAGYYLTADSAAALNSIFKSISEQISTPTIELGTETIVRDTVTEHFTVPKDASGVRLFTSAYLGGGSWAEPEAAEGLTPQFNGNTFTVTGFDYTGNFISENAKPDGTKGAKLIAEFEIKPIEGFIGGNNVVTNGSDSGIYRDAAAEAPLDTFPVPDVDVVIPTFTLQNEEQNIYLGTPADLDGFIVNKNDRLLAGGNRNDYVTIKYTLTDPDGESYSYTIPAGAAAGTWDGLPEGLLNGIDGDVSYTMTCEVRPVSAGSYDPQSAEATAKINVYTPEYSFKDSEYFLGVGVNQDYYEKNNIESGPLWKHGETPADASMGPAPVLRLEFNPPAKSFKADTDVTVTVKLNERDITALTRKIPAPINEDEDYHDFTVKVISGTIIINKETPGAAEDERFIFSIYDKDWKRYTVSVPANGSVEIHGLAEGSYVVDENGEWAWDYTSAMPGAKRLSKADPVITFNITNNPKNSNIINDSTSVVNNSRKAEVK